MIRVRFLGFGGQHDDGEHRGLWSRSKAFTDFEAVDLGQHQVEDDQIGLLLFHLLEAFRASRGRYGSKAFFLQIQFDQLENIVLVFDDEDFFACRAWHGSSCEPTRERALCQDGSEKKAWAN